MRISFVGPTQREGGTVAVFVAEGGLLTPPAAALDAECGGVLSRALSTTRFAAGAGEILEVLAPGGLEADRVLLVGIGALSKADAAVFEHAGGEIVERLRCSGQSIVTVRMRDLGSLPVSADAAAAQLAFGG